MPAKPSALLDTRVIYCGDNIDQLRKLPDGCVDLIYIDPPFNSTPTLRRVTPRAQENGFYG
jgi:16S rRNA G966 N2-methylase RsmD